MNIPVFNHESEAMDIKLMNTHVPHSGHPERDKTRVLAEVGETCRRAADGRRVILMMDAIMALSERGRDRMVNLHAEGRRQMDRVKTLVVNHEMITQRTGTPPTWKLIRDDARSLENARLEYDCVRFQKPANMNT